MQDDTDDDDANLSHIPELTSYRIVAGAEAAPHPAEHGQSCKSNLCLMQNMQMQASAQQAAAAQSQPAAAPQRQVSHAVNLFPQMRDKLCTIATRSYVPNVHCYISSDTCQQQPL